MEETKIKICGLFRDCDIQYVNETRPDFAGFVFYPPSHRYVTKEQMKAFREILSPQIPAVGVFVDAPIKQVAEYLNESLIQIAQLHGHEDEYYMKELRMRSPGCEIWKAFKITEKEDLKKAEKSSADRVLLDNGYGTGRCFDWKLAEEQDIHRPFLLAGGLYPGNIRDAVEKFRPWGVDVSSGVETNKKKDLQKIRQMVRFIREETEKNGE